MGRDNPILSMLSKITDLILLNFLMLISCLPVITIGASITAGHFAALRIKRDEGSVFGDFCRSFKENFKQATVIWIGFLFAAVGILLVLWFFGKQSVVVSVVCMALFLILFMVSLWVFPVLSKFVNSTGNMVRNGALLSVRHLFHTLAMIAVSLLPVLALIVSLLTIPVILLLGISLPVYADALLYNKVFLALEQEVLEQANANEQRG